MLAYVIEQISQFQLGAFGNRIMHVCIHVPRVSQWLELPKAGRGEQQTPALPDSLSLLSLPGAPLFPGIC